ncbi:MAG: peptidylprolyl isomerase [Candidatus Omnitrophica bacterium]|nr:peptidylprolyl isomerase [Candidatus Omnitrophota bacterium]MCF7891948.1 peptidylprolyl isomerase [Candidatus Omnitrophota bacterium]MCF7895490.1 peptidylprolyl isomerase [Candidatus Omnitrophota bacterium]MCF7897997.1 peptidylprolyl isomerase [Candidatus Omnitrophota bacterium]MCF7909649.1 peptidylprolyl isomerase [Candidatus Omnitrophota bacterium]
MAIEKGKKVSFDYTLTVDGQVIDSSKEREPLSYVHGEGKIIPGLASELEGMKEGQEKIVKVSPEDAYGKENPEAFKEVPKSSLPKDLEPKAGMMLQMQGPEGQAVPVKVAEVKDEEVVLDLNHPLAGKTLKFDVKVISVEQ